jgi:hypothetical protein
MESVLLIITFIALCRVTSSGLLSDRLIDDTIDDRGWLEGVKAIDTSTVGVSVPEVLVQNVTAHRRELGGRLAPGS